jgi:tetratricopeptide (TPR) repeat protein
VQAPAPAPVTARIEPMPAPAEPAFADAPASDDEPEDASLPKVQLTRDMLYTLMKAELEFQNGNWQGPYLTMLAMAQQTRDPRLARRAADMALAAKQSGESLVAVRLWRELAPESEEAQQYLLGLALLSDNLDEVGRIFEARLKQASPATRGVIMFQAQQFLARAPGKAAADALLLKLLAPYAESFEARVLLAQSAFARGDAAAAQGLARAALAQRPDSEIAVLTLAQVTADPDAVSALLATFLEANPKAREVRSAHARVLVTQKRYDLARKQFEIMLADQPDNAGTLYALGVMSMQDNDLAGAERYFTRYIDALDKSPDEQRDPGKVLLMLSQLAEERGDKKAAAAWLAKVDEEDEANYFTAQLKRGQLMAAQGDLAGARAMLAALKPDDPARQAQVVVTDAHLLREAGNAEAAYALLADGAKRYPSNPDLLYDYALMAEKTGRLDVMEASLRAVMAQAPDNHHAYNALGYSLAERNVRLPEALALIDKALKMAPDDPFIMDSMGWVQYRMGNLDKAEASLRRAYALRGDVDIAVHLGEVLWQKGKKADAQKLWREARAKDPKNDTLRSTLARLQLSL